MDTKFCKGNFLFKISDGRDLVTKREKEKNQCNHFEDFEAYALAASIFKYFSTSSTGVRYFLPIVPEVLF